MGNFLIFLIVASFLIERVCDRILFFISGELKDNIKVIVSTLIGILISFGMRVGILGFLMPYSWRWMYIVDYILTGILIGEGSSAVAKLMELLSYRVKEKRMKELKEKGRRDEN